jgi:hypothetical protein
VKGFAAFLLVLAASTAASRAHADAVFDAALKAEVDLRAEENGLDEANRKLDTEWHALVAAIDKSEPLEVDIKAYCEANKDKSDKDDACRVEPVGRPFTGKLKPSANVSATFAFERWCPKQAEDAKEEPAKSRWDACAAFVKARNARTQQKLEVENAKKNRDKVLEDSRKASSPASSLEARIAGARQGRCATAYCFGGTDGTKYAFEPVVDLPIGLTWAIGNGTLANHINASGLDVRLNAGARFWFAYDLVSVAVLLFQPSLTTSDEITVPGATEPFGSEAVRRPYPSIAFGFAGDLFLLTVSYDQLRNVRSNGSHDPNFLPDEVLSRTVTFGLYLAPLTAARNGIGASVGGKE